MEVSKTNTIIFNHLLIYNIIKVKKSKKRKEKNGKASIGKTNPKY